MTTVKDIAKIIASRHALSNAEAEIFMQMVVETINDGLLKDRQVKIKGFGTFKLQTVKERTSVNVNTGERVVIGEHDKISFTPDNMMKDLINKPFAQFDTVPIDDDSPLLLGDIALPDDEDTEDSEENTSNVSNITDVEQDTPKQELPEEETTAIQEDTSSEETVSNENIPEEETVAPLATEEPTTPLVDTADIQSEEESAPPFPTPSTDEKTDIAVPDDTQQDDECDRQYPRCRNIFIYYGVIINIVVAVIAFALGYVVKDQGWFEDNTPQVTPVVTKPIVRHAPAKPVAKRTVAEPADTITKSADSIKKHTEKAEPVIEKAIEKKSVAEDDGKSKQKNYDSDVRVRTGAYVIVGTDTEVTVREGQTLKSISRTYLGEGMECYIEAYNGITTVQRGDIVKIPKLKLKKSLKKKQ